MEGQLLRFHGQISPLTVFSALSGPQVKKFDVCFFPQISARGSRRVVERFHLSKVCCRELTRARDRWRIRADEADDSREDPNNLQSLSSPAAFEDSSDIVDSETFSRLPSSVPWDRTAVAVTIVTYLGVVHGPLGVGGLSVVAGLLHQPDLDSQTKAVSLVILQLLEAVGAVWLVQSTVKQHKPLPSDIFELNFSKVWKDRGWLQTSAVGLGGLLLVVGITSNFGACVPKDMEHRDPIRELLTAGQISWTCFCAVSCLITPYLEEYMYRGFLLTSLAAYFGWPGAVLASSAVFVVAHFPVAAGGQVLGLLLIGCLLGTGYVYTGNLATSFVIHALYNATLLLALSSSSSSSCR